MPARIDATLLAKGAASIAKALPGADQRAGKAEAELSAQNARARVHVIRGILQRSIRVIENKPFFTRWGSDVHYAGHEEFRDGNHSYLMPELHRVENGALANRIVDELNRSA